MSQDAQKKAQREPLFARYLGVDSIEGNSRRLVADRIVAFWLLVCGLGPFFGWLCTAVLFNETSWRWQYLARVIFAAVLPVATALPLVRYVRGRAALISGPLLLIITALPVLSCWWVIGDLHGGPRTSRAMVRYSETGRLNCQDLDRQSEEVPCEGDRILGTGAEVEVLWLPHTRRALSVRQLY